MHVATVGAIAGVALGLVMVIFEYSMLKRLAERRAVQKGKKVAEMDPTERKQFMGMVKFSIFLPPGFALMAWMFCGWAPLPNPPRPAPRRQRPGLPASPCRC
ncbi:MAG: hypothetical protein FJY43_08095 [Betaproteobacteria bacterium]|nr:hypothetical protein [Betaproteobacteria bacterium]